MPQSQHPSKIYSAAIVHQYTHLPAQLKETATCTKKHQSKSNSVPRQNSVLSISCLSQTAYSERAPTGWKQTTFMWLSPSKAECQFLCMSLVRGLASAITSWLEWMRNGHFLNGHNLRIPPVMTLKTTLTACIILGPAWSPNQRVHCVTSTITLPPARDPNRGI